MIFFILILIMNSILVLASAYSILIYALATWARPLSHTVDHEDTHYTYKQTFIVGFVNGFVFGFIDNLNVYIGLQSLEKYFRTQPPVIKAGLAGTFSSVVSLSISSYVSTILANLLNFKGEIQVLPQVLGALAGCLVGIYLPYHILRK